VARRSNSSSGCWSGYLGPQLDDAGKIFGGERRAALSLELIQLAVELYGAGAYLRKALVMLVLGVLHQKLLLLGKVGYLLFHVLAPGQGLVFQVHVGAGLVDEVDGLVGQEAVGDVALGQRHGLAAHLVGM
jgi:hypothetical protein